ncbi:MAG: gliding motility-associated C-terminal domain-containing protein [Bacteroidota bacterium]
MKRFFSFVIAAAIVTSSFSLFAQRGKDGAKVISTAAVAVNEYTVLTSDALSGSTTLAVGSSQLNTNGRFPGTLAPGDLIFIIQVQGASIQGGEWWWNWGYVDNYLNTGNNEFAEVLAVPGTTSIQLSCPLKNNYTASGRVEVIRVPRYTSLTINSGGELTCDAWNGSTGGILATEVLGNTLINSGGTINVSVKGFRGGLETDNNSGYAVYQYASTDNSLGSMKGEGIAGWGPEYDIRNGRYGRNPPANGGGGGNAHNAGGGGGANGGYAHGWNSGRGIPDTSTAAYIQAWNLEAPLFHKTVSDGGGRGGYSFSYSNQDATVMKPDTSLWGGDYRRNTGGLGGRNLDYNGGRFFMGGGGGAGDQDDSYGGAGGTGAGMAYLVTYGNISGSGQIIANGQAGFNAQGNAPVLGHAGIDGAGGGGAGGTILLSTTGTVSGITIMADGGKGGDQIKTKGVLATSNGEAEGPGGGGGGGYIAVSNGTPWIQANGGANGVCTATTGADFGLSEFPPNGATKGGKGTLDGYVKNFAITTVNDSICPGEVATLSATLSGTVPPGAVISWYDAQVGGNLLYTGNPYVINNVTTTTTYYAGTCPGTYRVAAVVYMFPFAPALSNDTAICLGQSVTLHATGGSNIQWTPATGLDNANSPNPVCSALVTTTYHVTIQSINGCSATDSVTVTVNSVTATITPDTAICAGQNIALIASGGTSYAWSTGGSGSFINVNPLTDHTYSVTVSALGCTDTASVNVAVNPLPVVNLGNDTTFCTGGNLQLNAGNPGATYLWQDNSTNQFFSVSASGTYFVNVTDETTCSFTDTIHVTVVPNADATITHVAPVCAGAASFNLTAAQSGGTWSGTGITSASAGTFNPATAGPGYFVITYSIAGLCGATDTTGIRVYAVPVVNLGNDTSFCQGGSVLLDAGNPGAGYLWQNSANTQTITATASGTYYVQVTDAHLCAATDTINISVLPNMNATIAAVTPMCANAAPVTLSAVDGGGVWSGTGITSQLPPTFDPGVAGSGNFIITYTIAGLCGDADTNTITVYSVPAINATNVAPSCPSLDNGSVSLQIVSGTAPYIYVWNTGDTTASAAGLSPGTYAVTVTDAHGCVAMHSSDLNVMVDCHGTPVIYLPNIFSPNSDGINDKLFVKGEEITSFTLVIYDRWGEKVFESSALDYGWDGTFKNKDMPAGVYVYHLNALMYGGSEVKKHGNITLVR